MIYCLVPDLHSTRRAILGVRRWSVLCFPLVRGTRPDSTQSSTDRDCAQAEAATWRPGRDHACRRITCCRGTRQSRLRGRARRVRAELRSTRRVGWRLLRLLSRREGRRPLGRCSEQGDGRALGAGHDGRRPLGHQGARRDDPGDRPLARLAGLRRASRRLLAGVRAAGQGDDHRAPAPRPSGGTVRLRRAGRPQRGRGPRPARGGDGASEASVGAGDAAGVSRAHPRVLRRRADAPGRSPGIAAWDSSSRTRSPRRSARTSTSAARRRFRTPVWPRWRRPAALAHAVRVPAATHAGGHESALQHLSCARRESGRGGVPRRAAHLRAQPRSAVRQRRRHRARHRARLQRLRQRRTRAGAAAGDAGSAGGAGDPAERAASTTSA